MDETESRGGCLATLILYAAWAVTTLGAIIDALAVREAVLAILAWVKVIKTETYHQAGGVGEDIVTNFGLDAIDNFVVLVLALAAVGFTIWIEYYFRKGRPMGSLYKRIGKVALVEVAIVVAAILIRVFVATVLL
jgi:hypothetical protein